MIVLAEYDKIKEYTIVKRISRLSVMVKDENERVELAHLTNTGRLLELIYSGNKCLCIPKKPAKTKIRLIGVPVSKSKAVLIDPVEQSKTFVKAANLGLIPCSIIFSK